MALARYRRVGAIIGSAAGAALSAGGLAGNSSSEGAGTGSRQDAGVHALHAGIPTSLLASRLSATSMPKQRLDAEALMARALREHNPTWWGRRLPVVSLVPTPCGDAVAIQFQLPAYAQPSDVLGRALGVNSGRARASSRWMRQLGQLTMRDAMGGARYSLVGSWHRTAVATEVGEVTLWLNIETGASQLTLTTEKLTIHGARRLANAYAHAHTFPPPRPSGGAMATLMHWIDLIVPPSEAPLSVDM